jgi:tight adherence protein C
MTPAAVLAALAAALAGVGLCDLVAGQADPRRRQAAAAHAPRSWLARGRLLARVGARLGARAPRDLEARLTAAGLDAPAADVMALKTGAAVVALPAALALGAALPGRLLLLVATAAPIAAFLVPDLLLRRRTRRRRALMEEELADVLDLLRVAVGAGLAPARALGEVGRRHPGLLAAELATAAGRIALGVPHDRALDALERRCPTPAIRPLAAALRRAARHGAPLEETLAAQALDARAERARRAAEAAAKAAPKIQLVVALLLVPSALLLVAAALAPAVLR